MCLRFLKVAFCVILTSSFGASATPLRFCMDPDNPPFSNRAGRGFDNQIAILVAHSIHRDPVFVWARNGRGFLREQFNRGACDVLMGAPQNLRGVLTTTPYYRSSYVFVTRQQEHLRITTFDDPHLNGRRIGLQALEENLSPPSLALIRTGHASQLVGFNAFGARGGEIVRAVAERKIGTAVVWGPLAGYFVKRDHLPLTITTVSPSVDVSGVPFAFTISMAVHKEDPQLREQLNSAISHLAPAIDRVLNNYGVPTVSTEEAR